MTNANPTSPVPDRPRRRAVARALVLSPLAALAAVTVLTGCGGSGAASGSQPLAVASLPASADPSASAPADAPAPGAQPSNTASGRPQIRVDTSAAEVQQLTQAWAQCLKDHGAPFIVIPGKGNILGLAPGGTTPPAAYTACEGKQPLFPPSEDPATNPDYARDWRDEINCVNSYGPENKVVSTTVGTWTFATSTQTGPSAQILRTCEIRAFGPG
jgi:hypothetical protein